MLVILLGRGKTTKQETTVVVGRDMWSHGLVPLQAPGGGQIHAASGPAAPAQVETMSIAICMVGKAHVVGRLECYAKCVFCGLAGDGLTRRCGRSVFFFTLAAYLVFLMLMCHVSFF